MRERSRFVGEKDSEKQGLGGMKPNSNMSTDKREAMHVLRPPAFRVFCFNWEIKTHKVHSGLLTDTSELTPTNEP